MPRPSKCRRVCALPQTLTFSPEAAVPAEEVILGLDEYEAIRLIDLEGMTQEECAQQMNISRTTITGIYEVARRKVADTLVNGKRLLIQGGNVSLCEYASGCCGRCGQQGCRDCGHSHCQKRLSIQQGVNDV